MQTFLPYKDFEATAVVLDDRRLGNQAYRECLTLVRGGWKNHPASKMWVGYERALCDYALALLRELDRRGRPYPHHVQTFEEIKSQSPDTGLPPWLGDERFHASHRANLLRKDPVHYGKFGWTEDPDMEYFWPTKDFLYQA